MLKNYAKLFAAATVIATSVSAQAITVNLNINDVSKCTVIIAGEEKTAVNGSNSYEIESYQEVRINPTEGNIIEYVNNGNWDETTWNTSGWSTYPSGYGQDVYNFNVKLVSLASVRTSSFTLNVDDASKISAQLGGTYSYLNLNDGANTVPFIPTTETSLTISSAVYGVTLYKVTIDGRDVEPYYGNYEMVIEDGSNVNVVTAFPDESVPVTFSYLNDGAASITSVQIDGTVVTNYNDPGFEVQLGKKLQIYFNTTDFQFNSIDCNGNVQTYVYGSYDKVITGATDFIIDATRYADVTYTADLNPDQVRIYKGSMYQNDYYMDLSNGVNTLTVNTRDPRLTISPLDGCYIISVTKNGESIAPNWDGKTYEVFVADNDALVISSAEIVRDNTLVIYIDNRDAIGYLSFENGDNQRPELEGGYNVLSFSQDVDLPFKLGVYSSEICEVYMGYTPLQPDYEGGRNYTISTVPDNSVLRIYAAESPTIGIATFTVAADAGEFEVVRDLVVPVTDLSMPLPLFDGTAMNITPAPGNAIKVNVNNEPIAMVDGHFVFSISGPTAISIEADEADGITLTGDEAMPQAIFSLQGVRIATDSIEALPAGIYIVNGKKVVKK